MRSLVVAAVVLAACKDEPRPPAPRVAPADPTIAAPSAPSRTSEVRVDRRVQLVSIVMRLAGADEYTRAKGTPYLDAVDAWFAPHTKHAAVALAAKLRRERGISYDAPMLLAVHLDEQLALVNADELPALDARWAGVDVEAFAAALRDFAATAKLDEHLAQHADYFAALERTLRDVIAREDPIAWFDATFGPAEASFVVVPSPIAGRMNFGPRATIAGTQQLYQILGVAGARGTIEVDDQLVQLLVHEMAHSYINPVFSKHRAAMLSAGDKIFALVEKPMRAQAYANAGTMLDESGVRAVVVNYMRDKHGDLAGAAAARGELRQSFLWIPELAEVFRKLQRAKTRDLEGHMPHVIAFFDRLAASYASGLPPQPFLGPIDSVHHRDPVWVVAPAGIGASYARSVHATLRPAGELVVGTPTTVNEHPGRDLVAYGSPADNPVVAFVASHARWKLEPDRIVLGKKLFTGPGLVLIACWYQRDQPSRGVVVYAAHDPGALAGINNVRHGPTDWLVARKQGTTFTVLGSGDFPRGVDGAWMLPGE